MGGMWILSLVWLAVFGVIIIALVGVVVRSCTLPRGLKRGGGAQCGRCRYPFASAAPRCPECGGEVGANGVITPWLAMKLRPGALSAALALLIVVTLAGSLVVPLTDAFGIGRGSRDRGRYQSSVVLSPTAELPSTNTMYQLTMLKALDVGAFDDILGGEVVLVLHEPGWTASGVAEEPGTVADFKRDRAHIRVLATDGSFQVFDPAGKEVAGGETFTSDDGEALFEAARINTWGTAAALSAAQTVNLVQTSRSASSLPETIPPPTPGYLNAGRTHSTWVPVGGRWAWLMEPWVWVMAVGTVVYAVVLTLVLRRRRRLLALAGPRSPPAGPLLTTP